MDERYQRDTEESICTKTKLSFVDLPFRKVSKPVSQAFMDERYQRYQEESNIRKSRLSFVNPSFLKGE